MIDRALKERVKFKQSIDGLNKFHLNDNGLIKIPHRVESKIETIDHSLLGKIWFCHGCKAIIFRGNKQ
jgi:hypothetical protein